MTPMTTPFHELRAQNLADYLCEIGLNAKVTFVNEKQANIRISYARENLGNVYIHDRGERASCRTHDLKDLKLTPVVMACWQLNVDAVDRLMQDFLEGRKADLPAHAIHVAAHYRDSVGYGSTIFHDDRLVAEFSGVTNGSAVHGEVEAAIEAFIWCEDEAIKRIVCFCNSMLAKWATGAYRAASPIAKDFVELLSSVDVEVVWRDIDRGSAGYIAARHLAQAPAGQLVAF